VLIEINKKGQVNKDKPFVRDFGRVESWLQTDLVFDTTASIMFRALWNNTKDSFAFPSDSSSAISEIKSACWVLEVKVVQRSLYQRKSN